MHKCSRCGRRYPTTLEVKELRRPDGTVETICKHCEARTRCDLCGFTSKERTDFGIRKAGGHWKVLCRKCMGEGTVDRRRGG